MITKRYCHICKKETDQEIERYDPDDLESLRIYVCNNCGEGIDFVD